MISRRRPGLLVPMLVTLGLAACSPPPPPPPPPVLTLTVLGGPDQNPGGTGTSSPVVVRILQLTATGDFDRADALTLIQREKATLADQDLGSEEFIIRPGETKTVTRELKKGTQFVGAVVQFRAIDRAKWRATAPVAASGPIALRLTIVGTTATLEPVAAAAPAKS